MKKKRLLHGLLTIIMMVTTMSLGFILGSCKEDDEKDFSSKEQEIFNNLIGTWYGEDIIGSNDIEWTFHNNGVHNLNIERKDGSMSETITGQFRIITQKGKQFVCCEHNKGYINGFLSYEDNPLSPKYEISGLTSSYVRLGDYLLTRSGKTDDGNHSQNMYSDNDKIEAIYQQIAKLSIEKELIDTQWRLEKKIIQYPDYSPFNGKMVTSYDYNGILTFSKDIYDINDDSYRPDLKLYLNDEYVGVWSEAWWNESESGIGLILDWNTGDDEKDEEYKEAYGSSAHIAGILNNGNLSLKFKSSVGGYTNWIYSLVRKGDFNIKMNQDSDNGNNETGNGGTSEAPRIGFYDFTATQKSLTVRYEIYNKSEANISNAIVYYGTSSNPTKSVSASITGNYITATISGLTKGTEYYVKCKATGKGGSTTTDVTKCITNY